MVFGAELEGKARVDPKGKKIVLHAKKKAEEPGEEKVLCDSQGEGEEFLQENFKRKRAKRKGRCLEHVGNERELILATTKADVHSRK